MALDKSVEDARPWIEAAQPTHPSLIDVHYRLADLYGFVNVPTVVWIDERGRIARPNDVAFGSDRFRSITGIDSEKHIAALRAWVKGTAPARPEAEVRALQTLPTADEQAARAHFGLALWLAERGRSDAAEPHFVRAGELAPHDFTIRRGSLPIRGVDPMGPEFGRMLREWVRAGNPYYRPLPHDPERDASQREA